MRKGRPRPARLDDVTCSTSPTPLANRASGTPSYSTRSCLRESATIIMANRKPGGTQNTRRPGPHPSSADSDAGRLEVPHGCFRALHHQRSRRSARTRQIPTTHLRRPWRTVQGLTNFASSTPTSTPPPTISLPFTGSRGANVHPQQAATTGCSPTLGGPSLALPSPDRSTLRQAKPSTPDLRTQDLEPKLVNESNKAAGRPGRTRTRQPRDHDAARSLARSSTHRWRD